MYSFFEKLFGIRSRYAAHPEAVIITCFFNPQQSAYRVKAFEKFYKSIRHLDHRVIECVIGDALPCLEASATIHHIHTQNLLWHKEALLNIMVRELPKRYRYIFWLDADVLFTNPNWLVEGVAQLQHNTIIQPFEWCVHLEQYQRKPGFPVEHYKQFVNDPQYRHPLLWRSFAANCTTTDLASGNHYDIHGHVGFAWGARREVLEAMPLYDKALIGGADHIIAHAAAGHIPHPCITKAFKDDIDEVNKWSQQFYAVTHGKIGYVPGELWHLWHGDLTKRDYLGRIRQFTARAKNINQRDENGLYTTDDIALLTYMSSYFAVREVTEVFDNTTQMPLSNKDQHTDSSTSNSQSAAMFNGGSFDSSAAGGNFS